MRDGFACRAADLAMNIPLTVLGTIRAGYSGATLTVHAGQAVEIMTGAPVPDGADCVVMVEHVQRDGSTIRLGAEHNIAAGAHIVPMGAEAASGSILLGRGTRIGAAHIGAAASCGAAHLSVFSRPHVAIVATGDELVELGEQPLLHQIRNSNSYGLAAQVVAAGAQPMHLPIARDEVGHLESIIQTALDADLVLLSGGVSMGKYDLVEDVLLSLGAEFFFTGALIQPGKPVVFGRLRFNGREVYFFGLPGNPVSTMVTFSLFVEPLLGALGGEPGRAPRFAQARLAREVRVKAGLTRFLPAVMQAAGIDVGVDVIMWQGSGDLASTSRSNCYLVIPEDRSVLAAGETVTVLLA
jgi:molybdopterin molybdotransferase